MTGENGCRSDSNGSTPQLIVGCIYAPPKQMKTSTALACFPNALCVGVPESIVAVGQNELGFTPRVWPWSGIEKAAESDHVPLRPQTLADVYVLLQWLGETGLSQQFPAVVIDDPTLIASLSLNMWKAEGRRTLSGKVDRYYPYQQLDAYMIRISAIARHLGCHVLMTPHEKAETLEGGHRKGGPDFGSATQASRVPAWFDVVFRMVGWPDYPDPWGVRLALWCDPFDGHYVSGMRGMTGAALPKLLPPSLRAVLQASRTNYVLERVPGLEWQDEVQQQVAEKVEGLDSLSTEAVRHLAVETAKTLQNLDELHVRWAFQEGLAAGIIRRKRRSLFNFDGEELTSAPGRAGVAPRPAPPPPSRE